MPACCRCGCKICSAGVLEDLQTRVEMTGQEKAAAVGYVEQFVVIACNAVCEVQASGTGAEDGECGIRVGQDTRHEAHGCVDMDPGIVLVSKVSQDLQLFEAGGCKHAAVDFTGGTLDDACGFGCAQCGIEFVEVNPLGVSGVVAVNDAGVAQAEDSCCFTNRRVWHKVVRIWSSIPAWLHALSSPWRAILTPFFEVYRFAALATAHSRPHARPIMLLPVAPVVKVLCVHSAGSRSTSSHSIFRAWCSTLVAIVLFGKCTWTFWSYFLTKLSASAAIGVAPPVTKP